MNALGEAIGELCKVILPIPEERFLGNPGSSVAVCTLSSIDLLKKFLPMIARSNYLRSEEHREARESISCLEAK